MAKYLFYGKTVSEYGTEHGYVDYATLASTFDAVLCNDITKLMFSNGLFSADTLYYDVVNGLEDEEDYNAEVFQYYIISESGYDILHRHTNEIVYYIEALDMYIWGVTHWGTSWDYVLTDIPISKCYKVEE